MALAWQAGSDGGAIVLKAVDRRLGLIGGLAACLEDRRQPGKVQHSLREILRLGSAVDRALLSYVRGQAVVCLVTGAGVGIVLALAQYPAALLLGLLTGVAQVISFLGFTVAVVTIALVGLSVDPFHAVLGAAIYAAVDWAAGTFVTPHVMERFLKLHPFVITVSVIVAARLLGPAGAMLALPGAAVLQALIEEVANQEEGVRESVG